MYNIVSKSRIIISSLRTERFEQAPAFLRAGSRAERSRATVSSERRAVSDFCDSPLSALPRGEKSEETRCALCAASRCPTLPDFHRAKSPVAYHTSGRHVRFSMPRIAPATWSWSCTTARGSAPCSSARGASWTGREQPTRPPHGRSFTLATGSQTERRPCLSVCPIPHRRRRRSSAASSFAPSSSFIETNRFRCASAPLPTLPRVADAVPRDVSNFRACPSVRKYTRVHRRKIKEWGPARGGDGGAWQFSPEKSVSRSFTFYERSHKGYGRGALSLYCFFFSFFSSCCQRREIGLWLISVPISSRSIYPQRSHQNRIMPLFNYLISFVDILLIDVIEK